MRDSQIEICDKMFEQSQDGWVMQKVKQVDTAKPTTLRHQAPG